MKSFVVWLLMATLAGAQGFNMDGTTGYFLNNTANWRSADTSGAIVAWVNAPTSPPNSFGFIYSSDVATDVIYWFGVINSGPSTRPARLQTRTASFANTLDQTNSDGLVPITFRQVVWVSTGTAYLLYMDGELQTVTVSIGSNDGKWLNLIAGRDNVSIGRLQRKTPATVNSGAIHALRVYSRPLTAQEVMADFNSRGANFPRVGLVYDCALPNGYATGNTIPNDALLADRSGGGLQLVSVSGATPARVIGTRLRRQNKRSM